MRLVINTQTFDVHPSADDTLLKVARQLGLSGTKEGCASGDCGACTVMVGADQDGKMRYQTVNACIAPAGQFEGQHIVTVEGLASGDTLHPAQAEMVACHGSQCGFCTPGFVMSLAALHEATSGNEAAEREQVLQGISGNLCRCTGYRPIVEAGLAACRAPHSPIKGANLLADVAAATDNPVIRPETEVELQAAIRQYPDSPLIAGGTDLMLEVTQRFAAHPTLIDLGQVLALGTITSDEDQLVIGAAASYTAMESCFAGYSRPFLDLLHRLGSRQIRNRGSLGGNLANGSPIADTPPALIAWDAELELVNTKGESRMIGILDFYRGYRDTVLAANEYIARIHIPLAAFDDFHRFYKSSKRLEDDISSVMGAFRFMGDSTRMTSARIAYGGMAATPVRLHEVESLLISEPITDRLIDAALERTKAALNPLTDVRASSDYRQAMAGAMLRRALKAFAGEEAPLVTEVDIDG